MSTNEDMMKQEFDGWYSQLLDENGELKEMMYPEKLAYIAWKASREYMLGMRFAPGSTFEPLRYTVPVITQTAGANPDPMLFMDTVRTIDDHE